MAALYLVATRLCDLVLGTSTIPLLSYLRPLFLLQMLLFPIWGLREPTAVEMNVDDVALEVFNRLRNNPTEGDKDLTLAEVTRIFEALSEVQNRDGAATSNIASLH
ncbi:hypothetical protein ACQJBY_041535 [Aegilops geniculata]